MKEKTGNFFTILFDSDKNEMTLVTRILDVILGNGDGSRIGVIIDL